MDASFLVTDSGTRIHTGFAHLSEPTKLQPEQRTQLFKELREEIETHLQIEEDHFLPLLRQDPTAKALVSDCVADNAKLRSLLKRISLSESSGLKPEAVKELQQAFRHHVRDEKNALIPALQGALKNSEPTNAVHVAHRAVSNQKPQSGPAQTSMAQSETANAMFEFFFLPYRAAFQAVEFWQSVLGIAGAAAWGNFKRA